jgi:putative phosphonate metabolism protein
MSQYPRYAIYFVPSADSDLYRFGASLIGYDAYSGQSLPFPEGIESDVEGWKQFTADPRNYGFHATLKAPISLAHGRTESELVTAMSDFTQAPRAIPMIAPTVRGINSFVAITPTDPCPELQKLAEDCVIAFDEFRAPLTATDRERRNVSALSERQVACLDRWGYPYVLEEFRFHMTLAGSLPAERKAAVVDILRQRFVALELKSVSIDRLALLRQNGANLGFTIISHWPLRAAV